MKDVIFITGNANKAKYFGELLGIPLEHRKVDVDEIQSLNLDEVVEHKARQAYELIRQPVLVEDVSLTIRCLGRLPGTFVKWFLEEIGNQGLCRLADADPERVAVASCAYGYFDGEQLEIIRSELLGSIPKNPKGDEGFGWNPVFIPHGEKLTLGEMDDAEFKRHYLRIKPISQVKLFLDSL